MKAEKYNTAWIILLLYSFGRGSEKDKIKWQLSLDLLNFIPVLYFFAMQNHKTIQFEKQASFQASLH